LIIPLPVNLLNYLLIIRLVVDYNSIIVIMNLVICITFRVNLFRNLLIIKLPVDWYITSWLL